MTPQNSLDHKGSLSTNPLAELLVEMEQAKLDGSMRLSLNEDKAVIYFRDGQLVYAVSNSREHRLLKVLLDLKLLEQSKLAEVPRCGNDVELAVTLERRGVLSKDQIDDAVRTQMERIMIDVLSWTDGHWHYSPLVRSREDLTVPINIKKVLADFARCLPSTTILARFKSVAESFERVADPTGESFLQSHEEFVLNQLNGEPKNIEQMTMDCGLPENGFLQALYVLWIGGLVRRRDWNAAFSENRIRAIRNARIALIKQAQKTGAELIVDPVENDAPELEPEIKPEEAKQPEISLQDFLARVEASENHYDVLGIQPKAAIGEIKSSYFLLAKLFHPDRFHREAPATLQRIQAAFSNVQSAYETLKSNDTRENYDFKIRKDLEMKEKLKAQGAVKEDGKVDTRAEQGLESFEAGLSLLMEEEYERAVPFLGRAAHYSPDNALYRAYYGKALSYDEKQRHKAESEMQAAIKLDPQNPKIRMMLVEFFMENNLMKRAEGELKRFLELVPNNSEAQRLLAKLSQ